jgi:alpha-D-xyloside xylohydrolase
MLTIADRKGSFKGRLNSRTFEIIWITPQKAAGLDYERKQTKWLNMKEYACS